MFQKSLALFATALVLASTPALAIMPHPRIPMPPIPHDALVLTQGAEVALEARLSVKNLEGAHAWAADFTRPVYEKVAVRYPAVHRPGFRPHPPFIYRQIDALMLASRAGHDLVALAKLAGPDAKVTLTGTYEDSPRTMTMVLAVTRVEIRGAAVPATLPSVQRMIASAKRAVRAHAEEAGHKVLSLSAKNAGGLRVRVTARLDGAGAADFLFDALTGDVVAVGTPE